MVTPPLKLEAGEEVVIAVQALRRKGIFGNRFGELVITNRRVAFMSAIMKAGVIGALASKMAKPMFQFPREAVTGAARVQLKKQVAAELTMAGRTERFVIDEAWVDRVIAIATTPAG